MASSTLLRNGKVLLHDRDDHITTTDADLLIVGNKITKIRPNIDADEQTCIIDCTDKIISPGFIDTHHHVWQTQLKGRHADETLLEYFPTGNFTSSLYNPTDVFWGQLGGCLELLQAGTTTVVDHAHMNYSPDHNHYAVSATASSGLRSVFCYTPTSRIDSWHPFRRNQNVLEAWVLDTFEELATASPFGDGRVTLGFAFDAWSLPKEAILPLLDGVAHHKIRTITAHSMNNLIVGYSSLPALLDSYGILDERVILAHSNQPTTEEIELCRKTKFNISSTPETELQMSHGTPVCFQDEVGLQDRCSLGVDCHTNNSTYMPSQMRIALQAARGRSNEKFTKQHKFPRKVYGTVEEAFNLGTIQGARAIGMSSKIGSIAEGKIADLVILDATSPALVCAAQHDPVAAVVLHSSPADVDMVIVDGIVRKREGKLLSVQLDGRGRDIAGGEQVGWSEVSRQLIKSRAVLQKQIDTLDMAEALKDTIKVRQIDETKIVDHVQG